MATLKEIQAKARKNRYASEENTAPSTSLTKSKTLEDIKKKAAASAAADVDDQYIRSYLSDSQKFFSQAQSDYSGLNWTTGSDKSKLDSRKATAADLLSREKKIRAFYSLNKDGMDESAYNNMMEYLDSTSSMYGNIGTSFDDAYNFYSQWESEDLYMRDNAFYEKYGKLQQNEDYETASGNRDLGSTNALDYIRYSVNYGGGSYYDPDTKELVQLAPTWRGHENYKPGQITDKLGFYLEYKNLPAMATLYERGGDFDNVLAEGAGSGWEQMTDQQIADYYYLYNTQGQAAAYEYLDDIAFVLRRDRYMQERADTIAAWENASGAEKLWMEAKTFPTQFVANVTSNIDRAYRAATGAEWQPYTGIQYANNVRQLRAEELNEKYGELPVLGFSAGDAYQALMSGADSTVNALLSGGMAVGRLGGKTARALGALITSSTMGGGAYSAEAQRLYEQGATQEQIVQGATAAATIETLTEMLPLDNLIKVKDGRTVLKWFKNAAIQAGLEGAEEVISGIGNTFANHLIMKDDSDLSRMIEENGGLWGAGRELLKQSVNDFIGGALAGGISGNVGAIGPTVSYGINQMQTGADIRSGGFTGALTDSAADMISGVDKRTGKQLQRQVDRVNKKATNNNVGKLYNTVVSANQAQIQKDAGAKLESEGFSKHKANAIAEAMIRHANGEQLTSDQEDLLSKYEKNSTVQSVYDSVVKQARAADQQIIDKKITQNAAMVTEKLVQEGVEQKTAEKIADVIATAQKGEQLSAEANEVLQVVRENPKLAKAVQAATEAINMSAEDAFRDLGNRYSGGNQVIASMPKLQQDTFARIYDSKVNGTAVQFADAMAAAYALGYDNRAMNLEGVDGALLSTLTEAQRQFAWKEGRSVAASDAKSAQKTMDSVYKKAEKALKKSGSNAAVTGKVTTKGISVNKMNPEQKTSYDLAQQIAPAVKADIVVYKGGKEWGFYDHKTDSIHLNANAKRNNHNMMVFALAHELVHRAKKGSPMQFKAFSDFLLEQYGKQGADIDAMIGQQMAAADRFDQTAAEADKIRMTPEMALEEVICDAAQRMLLDTDAGKKLAQWGAQSQQNKGFLEKVKSIIQDILNRLRAALKGVDPDSLAAQEFSKMEANAKKILADMFVDMSIDAGEKLSTIKAAADAGHDFAKQYLATKNVQYNLAATESHKAKLQEKYSDESTVSLETLMNRYDKILSIWKKLGGELDSKFLNDWNSKKGKDRAFTIFKAQAGYKYNVELSSMCKKGVPLFEAIDTIVKNEVMKELGSNVLGKAEKEILYDILKQHHFEIPCAICYVEQARQREGVIIDAFLNGNAEKAKLGWNQVLDQVQTEMAKRGVEYSFPQVSRDIATDEYTVRNEDMDQKTQDAFYEALRTVANQEISRYNKAEGKSRKLLKDASPESVKECFKGTLPANLKLFKVLFAEPNSRFKIESDLLYSSRTTQNLAMAHNQLYSLFNSQGGVSGYKTKQGTTVYWGDILSKNWRSSTLRKEGGVRNQSNSDFQMYTLLDQVQMYMDFSAKGYYLQAYTKVLSELKLFGLSRGKINASLIPSVVVYKNADGSVNVEKTMENAGLDEKGNPIYDDFEGINHKEAFMLISDPEYSKSIGGVCIGYSDNHIKKLLDDDRVQLIIGFHDKTNDPNKRYRGARYAKNYNGINEAVRQSDGKTIHIGFNSYVKKAENKFHYDADLEVFEGSTTFNGKTYTADDIPRLAADLYLADCEKKGYDPAYNIEGIVDHPNYYKLLADFSLYNSQGYYAPHQKVAYNMPDTVPFLDANGNKQTMRTEDYIKAELEKELVVRDDIAAALADESSEGIIPQFKAAVAKQNGARSYKVPTVDSDPYGDFDYSGLNWARNLGIITNKDAAIFERTINNEIYRGAKPISANGEYIIDTGKCLMFTDGDFHRPTLNCVIVFATEYESVLADAKEMITVEAESTGEIQASLAVIETMYGPGFARIYYPGVGATNGWQNGRGKGNNSGQPYRRNRPRSLKEILAQQGIKNFKLPAGEDADQSQAARDTLSRYQEALRDQKDDTHLMEVEFRRIARAYETQERRGEKKIEDLRARLKDEAKKHRKDQKIWEAEFERLLKAYDAAGRNIQKLEETVAHQRQAARDKVEGRRKTEMRHKIIRFKENLQATLEHPTDNNYVPVDLISAMVDVCELIDDNAKPYKKNGSINKAQAERDATRDRLLALKDQYTKLKNPSDPIYAGEFDEMVETYLDELRQSFDGRSLKDMSLMEMGEMYEILRSINETLQDARKLIDFGEKADVYEAGDSIIEEQRSIINSRKNGRRNAVAKLRDTGTNYTLSPMRNVERMSDYNADSYLVQLFRRFELGVRKKNKFMMDAYQLFEKLTSGKEYDAALYEEVGGKKYEDVNGRKFGISKMQMMQAILSFEREVANNHNHIQKGGFTFADLDKLKKGKVKEAISEEYAHRVPAAIDMIAEFSEILRDDKWCQEYMAASRSFFNGMAKDAINETSIAWKHRIVAQEKSYIPYEVDKNFVVSEISAANNIQETINAYGMLKATQDKAPQPLIITGLNNVLDRHIEKVGSVYGLAIPVRNFNKVWNMRSNSIVGDPTVKSIIELAWGKEGIKNIEQTVQDIQGPRKNTQSAIYKKIKSNYIGATFLLNLSVVTKQIGSLFSATSMLRWRDPIRMMGNLFYTMVNHKKIAAEVNQYTASAWMRRQGISDAELHTLMTEAKKSKLGKIVSKLPAPLSPGKWIAAMDYTVALSLWKYAKIDTAKRTGLKGEELLVAAAEFYDDLIENTQSMTDVLHRPEVQKRGDILSDAFGMFKTDVYQMAGQLRNNAGRVLANNTAENRKALGRTIYSIAMGAIWSQLMTTLFALLRYKVNPYRDEEDEDLTVESWLKRQGFAFAGDMLGYVFPLLGSEAIGFVENIKYGETEDFMDSVALTAINDLYDLMTSLGSKLDKGEPLTVTDYRKLGTKALQMMGVPANNILRTWDAIKLHAEDIKNKEFFSFEAGADRTPANHAHRIFEAASGGNVDKARDLYDDAIEDILGEDAADPSEEELSEARSSLQSAFGKKYRDGEIDRDTTVLILSELFGKSEDDIYWIMDKWDYANENGSADGYAKFDDFYTAVETGKDLKKTIKVYIDNGVKESTLKAQVTDKFKPIYLSLSRGDQLKLRGYLINAFVACGDTREQAMKKIDKWE